MGEMQELKVLEPRGQWGFGDWFEGILHKGCTAGEKQGLEGSNF